MRGLIPGMNMLSLLLLLLFCTLECNADLSQDRIGLLSLKQGVRDPLGHLQNWISSTDAASICSSWPGVECNSAKSAVTSLDLHSKNLTGVLPEALNLLSSLKSLNLSDNRFSGRLPISNLTALIELDISRNSFSGPFPLQLCSNSTSLRLIRAFDNDFSGPIPAELGLLHDLQLLDLAGSYFTGSIPAELGRLAKLEGLRLSANLLVGRIPSELGNLTELRLLEIGYNAFDDDAVLPPELGNLRNLEYLDVASSGLSGSIPRELGLLSACNSLFLFGNRLTGGVPAELGNMSSLMSLDLSSNNLSGAVPEDLGRLSKLTLLSLMFNRLEGPLPMFLETLPKLETLKIFDNRFTGSIPASLGTATSLAWIDMSSNRLTGQIPSDICDGGGIVKLELFNNGLSGPIPDLSNCKRLVRLRLQSNELEGELPRGFPFTAKLERLELGKNRIVGGIPEALAAAESLAFIDLSRNRLTGSIPTKLWSMPKLQALCATKNMLSGAISASIGHAGMLAQLDLSDNLISGIIPDSIAGCTRLVSMDMRGNRLAGSIPGALGALPALAVLDLSWNGLSGAIPASLEHSGTLEVVNLAYNCLSGRIPTQGVFRSANASFLTGNPGLCSMPTCAPSSLSESTRARDGVRDDSEMQRASRVIWIMGCVLFAIALGSLAAGSRRFYKQYWDSALVPRGADKKKAECSRRPLSLTGFQRRLGFTAYDLVECLHEANIVGKGSSGTVYRAEVMNMVVAVKKLRRIRPKEGDSVSSGFDHGFLAEVNVLGTIRHRNIVRLLGFCSNGDTNLLIYEYMPNGSLSELLHGSSSSSSNNNVPLGSTLSSSSSSRTSSRFVGIVDWITRYNIAFGVAQGLCYLHHDCFPQIVHRDVKSSNILLDSNMEARVADFGVAKLIEHNGSMSVIAGSYGYIAPEYAYSLRVDATGDIYSFGVVLLELVTGRRPVEPEFGECLTIVDWVRAKITTQNGISEVLDPTTAASCTSVCEEMMLVLRIALLCTSKSPRDRPSMRDVVTMLSEAKPRRKETDCAEYSSPPPPPPPPSTDDL